jgi:superfamily I DNA and/or RNA helicase
LASAGGSVIKKTTPIDDLIVDEAAAATEPELYIPFQLKPKRLLAVGDPDQLPPTVISRRANAMGYAKSLHERLMYDCKYDHIMLDIQYRMNPEISSFPSSSYYQSKIKNGENVMNSMYAKGALLLDRKPYTFLQVEGKEEQLMGGSYCNRMEATIIVDLISNLHRIAVGTASKAKDGQPWYGSDRVRVITFYQAQVSCIQKCLVDRGLGDTVVVATVDSSQGCEADIVLISFVRSQGDKNDEWNSSPSSSMIHSTAPATRTLGAGFLTDKRRMNVSLTRAKYQLICVGNVRVFPQMPNAATLHQLAMNAEERGIICDNYSTTLHRQPPKKLLHSFNYT